MKKAINILIILLVSTSCFWAQTTAIYTLTFTGTWNSTDHSMLPGNAHWSDLVGTNHNSNITFWEVGMQASTGIENVAEVGSNTSFNNEVDIEIANSNAEQWLQKSFDSPNNATSSSVLMSIQVTEDFPLLTLISMIAPSPDWFIGINSLSLLDTGGNWKDTMIIDMFPYDAGTEDGSNYSTSNAASNPQQNITSRINTTPFNNQKVGTLTITLESVLNIDNPTLENQVKISPNPTNGIIQITTSNPIKELQIYNLLGKQILKKSNSNQSLNKVLNLKQLNAGIYLLKIHFDDNSSIIRKIIKN